MLENAYAILYSTVLVFLGIAILLCLIRTITGKRTVDSFIGINMIKEAFDNDDEDADDDFTIKTMIGLAIATSIDALSVGVEFSFEHLPFSIFIACLIIAVITFIVSGAGVYIGSIFGNKFKKPAEITGGVILILIGLKILLTGFGILNF